MLLLLLLLEHGKVSQAQPVVENHLAGTATSAPLAVGARGKREIVFGGGSSGVNGGQSGGPS